ncbi:STAS domain-containing protein [Paenibacillus chartarius]|uniref:STAS domain-containing protein n=1 Tax=Paenibacillus chartarius TaxID=747481 RepID=A0ABV6DPN4_9BACL
MQIPIIKIGNVLLVTLHPDITDDQAVALKQEILVRIQKLECSGLLIDIGVVDLIDSYMGRVLNEIVEMARLLGASSVISGMSPQVAIAMVEFGLTFRDVRTALTVEKGLEWFAESSKTGAKL